MVRVLFLFLVALALTQVPSSQAQESDVFVSQAWKDACQKHLSSVIEQNYKVGFNKGKIVCYQGFIDKTGGITGFRIHRSSGSIPIDKTALELIQKAAPFPDNKDAVNYKVGVVIRFSKQVELKFYPLTEMPLNYDVKQTYIKKWLADGAQKIKRYGIKKATDPNAKKKWVEIYRVEKPCSCSFILGSNGEVTYLKVKESAGDSEVDDRLLKLIQHAAPYRASSASSLPGTKIDVLFTGGNVQLKIANTKEKGN